MTTATKLKTATAAVTKADAARGPVHASAYRWKVICQSPMVRDAWEIHDLLERALAKIEAFRERHDEGEFDRTLAEAGVACDAECWGNSCKNLLYDVRGIEWGIEMAVSVLAGELPGDPEPVARKSR